MSNDECTAAHWDEFGIPASPTKNAKISARETNRTKKSMSTTVQTYWPSSAKIWEDQRNYSLKNEVDKNAISCFSIRKDWRFAVRAKSLALHWRSRGFFRGHVRSCEKGRCHSGLAYSKIGRPKRHINRHACRLGHSFQVDICSKINHANCSFITDMFALSCTGCSDLDHCHVNRKK